MSTPWPADAGTVRAMVSEAARAPSVHNVQPARWAIDAGRRSILLLRDPSRSLPVADPDGRDDRVSLGAALEGFAIAATVHGLGITALAWHGDAHARYGATGIGGLPIVAAFTLRGGAAADPLAPFVGRRRSWRGPMEHGRVAVAGLQRFAADPESGDAWLIGREHARRLARVMEAATWTFEREQAYHTELWQWLRLDRHDPAYRRDGLTADALVLSEPERLAARVALHPRVFRQLQRTGLGRFVVSEAGVTRSAAAFICHCPPVSASDYEVGRGMYRLWLAATRAGLVLAPMSALVDDPLARAEIESLLSLPADRRLSQLFRAGTLDRPAPPSPRLPVSELLQVLEDRSPLVDGEG